MQFLLHYIVGRTSPTSPCLFITFSKIPSSPSPKFFHDLSELAYTSLVSILRIEEWAFGTPLSKSKLLGRDADVGAEIAGEVTLVGEWMSATPKALENVYTAAVLNYGTMISSVFNIVALVGSVTGCLFCLWWMKMLRLKFPRRSCAL